MNEDRFEELMRDAAHTYRRPPEPPLDEMWAEVEMEAWPVSTRPRVVGFAGRLWHSQWVRVAAALVIGVGIGRVWTSQRSRDIRFTTIATTTSDAAARAAAEARLGDEAEPYQMAASKYLGQTAALLIALPSESRGGRTDRQFAVRAGDLLLTTRLLLDSPAASDPQLRDLLEDLELVLAQIVRLPDERGRTELELINQALEQRDVLPRLRSAVADISADDD
jgi:hypothetical protein